MKKLNKSLIMVMVCCVMTAMLAVGCDKAKPAKTRVETPTGLYVDVSTDRTMLIFDEVDNARGYVLRIDGARQDLKTNYLDATALFGSAKDYKLTVQALAKDGYLDSYDSDEYVFSNKTKISAPAVVMSDGVISWTPVANASSYVVRLIKPDTTVTEATITADRYDIKGQTSLAGVYGVSVKVLSGNKLQADSDFSQNTNYTHYITLQEPKNLSINKIGKDVVLSFVADEKSNRHMVNVDGQSYNTVKTTIIINNGIDLSGLTLNETKRYIIKVRSSSDSVYYGTSQYSSAMYFDNYTRLSTPVMSPLQDNGNNVLATWENVNNANEYNVYVNNTLYRDNVSANSISIPKSMMQSEQMAVKVEAIGYGLYEKSLISDNVYYSYVVALDTPYNISVSDIGGTMTASWNAINGANSYVVEINGAEYETTNTSLDISNMMVMAGLYNIRLKARPAASGEYVESSYSASLSYTRTVALGTVQNVAVINDKTGYHVTFVTVVGAVKYNIYINNTKLKSVAGSPCDITTLLNTPATYTLSVRAIAPDPSYYTDSQMSGVVSFEYRTKLSMPSNLSVNRAGEVHTLLYGGVVSAEGYTIKINDTTMVTTQTSVDISSYIVKAGLYKIQVRANAGDDNYYQNGEYAQYDYYVFVTLTTPSELKVVFTTEGRYMAMWDMVSNADSYVLNIYNASSDNTISLSMTSLSADITDKLTNAGQYNIKVMAKGSGYYVDSVYSQMIQVQKNVTLGKSRVLAVSKVNGGVVNVSFQSVANATAYNIRVNDVVVLPGWTNSTFDLRPYMLDEGRYTISIQAIGEGSYTSGSYSDTYNYDYVMITADDFDKYDVFMYGQDIDMHIDTYQEAKLAVWYNYLYGKTTMKLYIPSGIVNSIINSYTVEYGSVPYRAAEYIPYLFLIKYPEYWSFDDWKIYTYSDNIVKFTYIDMMDFDHQRPFDAEELAQRMGIDDISAYNNSDKKIDNIKNTPYQPGGYLSQSNRDRADEFDSFAINSKIGVKVYNTEQLFMVAQYGRNPILPTGESVVKTVYENAKNVLRRIVRSDYSEYQKALVIYEWVTLQNIYDHNTQAFIYEYANASRVNQIGQYSDFYLEGILYDLDASLSVCDGIAKTFALLCNIEGIETIKINGMGGDGNHAWNKIKLGDRWYIVDSTWGDDLIMVGNEYFQLMQHQYFLKTEASLNTHVEEWPNDPGKQAVTDFNYYENTTYSYNGGSDNLIIGKGVSSDTIEVLQSRAKNELRKLLDYGYSDEYGSAVMDFKFSDVLWAKWKNGSMSDTDIHSKITDIFDYAINGRSAITFRYNNVNAYEYSYIILTQKPEYAA